MESQIKGMGGLVKVGHSMKDHELRAQELDHTGSPHPYVVEYEMLIEEPYKIEQAVHKALSNFHEGKEWFRCTPEHAVVAIRQAGGGKQISESFKRADRKKAEELHRKEEELRLVKEAEEKQKALVRAKEQQIIDKHDKIIKDVATAKSTGVPFVLAFFISLIGLGIIDEVFFDGKTFGNEVVFIVIVIIATVEDFNKAIELNPNSAQVYKNRGIAYKLKGQYDEATKDSDKAISLEKEKRNIMLY